jgi:hypothetical protein
MKKIAIITSAALLLTAAVSAQTDTVPKQNTEPVPQQPASTEQPASEQPVAKVYNDKYNNWSADTYKMQPMPEALTIEKIFPVIGKYEVTNKEGAATTLTVTLDETNKGIVWIEGLPQGKIKATLRKSPATYKIPVQPLEAQMATEEPVADAKDTKVKSAKSAKAEKAKELPEGVLIYDKDANVVNLCLGCKYNNDDPAMVFTPASEQEATEEPAEQKKTTKTAKKTTAKKTEKTKPVHYSGSKVIEDVPATTEEPVQQQQQPQQQQ